MNQPIFLFNLKILFLLGSGSTKNFKKITGPESRLKYILPQLNNHCISVIYSKHGYLNSYFQNNLKVFLTNYITYDKYNFFKLLLILIRHTRNVDCIHCHGPYIFDFISSVAGIIRNKKIYISRLVCVSEDYLVWYKRFFFQLLDNINVLLGANYLTISLHHQKVLYNELRFINYFRTVGIPVIYNGVSRDMYYRSRDFNSSQNSFSISVVAHLTALKGHSVLFKSISRNSDLQKKISSVTIVGDGPLRSSLMKECANLKIDRLVHFVGLSDKIVDFLINSDIVVLPSYREGFPVSLIEAQMSGCLTIASDVGANYELIKNNHTGFLFKAGDHIELSNILSNVVNNWSKSSKLAQAGQKYSVNYCSNKMIKEYKILYQTHSR